MEIGPFGSHTHTPEDQDDVVCGEHGATWLDAFDHVIWRIYHSVLSGISGNDCLTKNDSCLSTSYMQLSFPLKAPLFSFLTFSNCMKFDEAVLYWCISGFYFFHVLKWTPSSRKRHSSSLKCQENAPKVYISVYFTYLLTYWGYKDLFSYLSHL